MKYLLSLLLFPALAFAEDTKAVKFLKRPDAWFGTDEARRLGDNILTHQAEAGGWPKNCDTVSMPFTGARKEIKGTFDNSATTDELRFLARSFNATGEARYRDSFIRGVAHILDAQYPHGGWPQYFPVSKTYNRHVTFNDGAMVRLMTFLREVGSDPRYAFVEAGRRVACLEAFDKGVGCILKCQIMVEGRRTVWCQQHHAETLEPVGARTYELPSFSGAESVGVVRLLMGIEHPSDEVKASVEGAVAWLDAHKITGLRIENLPDEHSPTGKNLVAIPDAAAPAVWSRFYDLKHGRPYFCDRDGVPKREIAEIGYERRNGYGWYGNWPQSLLETDYPAWQRRLN